MYTERVEASWIEAFVKAFTLCGVKPGEPVAILSETQSRKVNVQLAELALLRLGAAAFHVVMPTPPQTGRIPIRSTGSSQVLGAHDAAIAGLAAASLIVDVTIEGVLNSAARPAILAQGARHYFISNEHPELLERCVPDAETAPLVAAHLALMQATTTMHVTSAAGSDLVVNLTGSRTVASSGFVTKPGTGDHWPGGLVACFPAVGTTNGRLVLDRGDLNLTFKRYNDAPITLVIDNDFVVEIIGDGVDAEMLRDYMADWNDPNAYATSHVGWGLNRRARWDAATFYDRSEINGTEQRAFAGNFLFSTGSNYGAGRFSPCHFDWPLRRCTIALDGRTVVDQGRLLDLPA